MKRNVNETVYLTKLNNGDNQTAIKLTMTMEKVKVTLSNKNVLHIRMYFSKKTLNVKFK